MFLIPAVVCSIVTLLVNPLILFTILLKDKLRKETRYTLLANVMIADLIFLLFNNLISACNAIRWYVHRLLCFTMIVFSFAAYTSCVLTYTVMVIDTYIAICFPLHYYSLLSVQRTRKILAAIWIFSAVFPLSVFAFSDSFNTDLHERQNVCLLLYYEPQEKKENAVTIVCSFAIFFLMICSVMIMYFYIRLYKMTRQLGIWVSRFSRAKITLLTHSILLCLYIVPAFILTVEIMLFKNNVIGMDIRMWITASNNGVIMVMPRALSPVLYGLRYREITTTLKLWFSRNKVSFTGTGGFG
ncbi:PREDICTED: probable G-protein coupled receptor 148 [Nanorana parkeri]|uniref:probable G-protein coupled receptor 148 n=1 Tax=Nanorana parkeri TaxID=125878 RepID=UPI0008544CD5|nr:PREDICTED: probable G-protein coupled receptor 148 [Nanorana parkeri]